MYLPGWKLHPLKSDLQGHASVDRRDLRLLLAFEGEDAVLVDYTDYH